MKRIGYLVLLLFFIPIIIKAERKEVYLEKCVDGDTAWFRIENSIIKARFLAIDTPESTNKIEPYGKEASKYTCNLLTKAKKIEIEYDPNSDKTDKYNRDLVWVFADNELLQEKIIENGLAEVKYIYGKYKYTSILEEKQRYAKENKLNIWSNAIDDEDILDQLVNDKFFIICLIATLIILFLFNKRIRNNIINKTKRKIKKKLKSFNS